MHKLLSSVAAFSVALTIAIIPAFAEKGGNGKGDEGKGKGPEKHDNRGGGGDKGDKGNRGNGRSDDIRVKVDNERNTGRVEIRGNSSAKGNAGGEKRGQARSAEVQLRNDIRKAEHDRIKEAQREVREDRINDLRGRNFADDFDDDGIRELHERAVFVRGIPTNDPRIILLDVSPDREDAIVNLIRNRDRNDRGFFRFLNRNPEIIVGRALSDRQFDRLTLLPIETNRQLGLPTDGTYRLAVVGNQLVLLDTDRQLVLDRVTLDSNDKLVLSDIQIPTDKLYVYRIDDNDRGRIHDILVADPTIVPNITLGDRLRNILGLQPAIEIGQTIPINSRIVYLPESVNPQVGLPSTDLRLGMIGDDLVLIDPDTNIILDVKENII